MEGDGLGWACRRTRTTSRGVTGRACQWLSKHAGCSGSQRRVYALGGVTCYIPNNEVRRDPVVAESIFCVMEVVTSTGLPIRLGSAGMSRAPLPDGERILSCGCPCVCSDAISCLSILILIWSSFCCSAPANAGSYGLGAQVVEVCPVRSVVFRMSV